MTTEDVGEIAISESVIDRLEQRLAETDEFESLDTYAEFILSTVLRELEGEGAVLDDADRDVQEHLEALGYADE